MDPMPMEIDKAWSAAAPSLLELLPLDLLMTIVGDYVGQGDLPSLVQLAACSKTLTRQIYRDAHNLWVHIDFETLRESCSNRLNDVALSALLRRVDAKNVTKSLSLRNCIKLRGSGLEPLRGSRALEEIDLSLHGTYDHTGSETGTPCFSVVRGVLSSMPPFSGSGGGLRIVKASIIIGDESKKSARNELMNSFRASLANKMVADRTECHHCSDALVDTFPSQCMFSSAASQLVCYQCKNIACGSNGCPATELCTGCTTQLCSQCEQMLACASCETLSCHECESVMVCKLCKVSSCYDCDQVDFCSKCSEHYCVNCRDNTWCFICEKGACENCRSTEFCTCCGDRICVNCKEAQRCSCCNDIVCENEDCSLWLCNLCDKGFCEGLDCSSEFGLCDSCDMCYCKSCMAVTYCDHCERGYCRECRNVKHCRFCDKEHCKKGDDVVKCIDCKLSFYKECGFDEVCGKCEARRRKDVKTWVEKGRMSGYAAKK